MKRKIRRAVESRISWFNATTISTVPEDLLPKKALTDMGGVTGRKASIIKMKKEKGEVGRESVRRGSESNPTPPKFDISSSASLSSERRVMKRSCF